MKINTKEKGTKPQVETANHQLDVTQMNNNQFYKQKSTGINDFTQKKILSFTKKRHITFLLMLLTVAIVPIIFNLLNIAGDIAMVVASVLTLGNGAANFYQTEIVKDSTQLKAENDALLNGVGITVKRDSAEPQEKDSE